MTNSNEDPVRLVAEQVADGLWQGGYAFLEDHNLEPLAATLRAFLATAGIPINVPGADNSSTTTIN